MLLGLESLLRPMLGTIRKQLVPLSCHVNVKTYKPCSNFSCCCMPSSRWQRQWIKHLLFKCTYNHCDSHVAMGKYRNNALQVQEGLYYKLVQSKGALFQCQLCGQIYSTHKHANACSNIYWHPSNVSRTYFQ